MEYIKVSKGEYEQLLRYRDIIMNMEEEFHQQLRVKPVTDKRAISVMKKIYTDIRSGKRKSISNEEFLKKYRYLIEE